MKIAGGCASATALMLEELIRLHPPVLGPYICYRRDGREERKRWIVWRLGVGW